MVADYVITVGNKQKNGESGKVAFTDGADLSSWVFARRLQNGQTLTFDVDLDGKQPAQLVPVTKTLKMALGRSYTVTQSGKIITVERH